MNTPSSKCRYCPLYSRLAHFVPACGPDDAVIAIVGEAPGEREVIKHEPFVGGSGNLLTECMEAAGLERRFAKLTNILKCRPVNNKLPEGADLAVAVSSCNEIVRDDVSRAKVIVGLGNLPLRAFTGYDKITVRRGSVYELPDGRPYVASIHPSWLLRTQHIRIKEEKDETKKLPKEILVSDLKRAKSIAMGLEDWRPHENYILEPTQQELAVFLERLYSGNEQLVTIDIEAPMVRPIYAVPTIVGFYLDDVGICINFEEELEFCVRALMSPTAKGFCNGIYDYLVFVNCGIEVVNWKCDANYMHHLLYAELSHKLYFIQSLHAYLPFHKDMRAKIKMFNEELEESWEK